MLNFQLNLLKKIAKRQSHKGFTLTELLVGAFISVIVVGAAGWGLIQMLNASGTNSDETETRAEVNRAIDFISDEVRRARKVYSVPGGTVSSGITTVNIDGTNYNFNGEPILRLEIPDVDADGNDEMVVYHIVDGPDGNWLGPQILYRTGPTFDANGEYSIPVSTSTNALIDRLDEVNVPACGGTLYPPAVSGKVQGFAICLENGNLANGWETAQLFFNGTFSSDDTDTYTADSKVTARLNDDVFIGAATPDTSAATTGTTSNCTVTNNQLTCSSDTVISARSIGSSYACNTSTPWEMSTSIKVGTPDSSNNNMIPEWDTAPNATITDGNTSNPIRLPQGESIQVTSDPFLSSGDEAGCYSSSDIVHNTNTTQVQILELSNKTFFNSNGFDADNNGTPDQDSVLKILDDEGLVLKTYQDSGVTYISNNDDYRIESGVIQEKQDDGSFVDTVYTVDMNGYVVDTTGSETEYVLNIEKDQQFFLYLFEIGHSDTNAPANGFDQNDNIVLITTDQAAS